MGAREDAERFFKRHDIWVNLVTQAQIARRWDVSPQLLSQWIGKYPDFPQPLNKNLRGDAYMALFWWPDVQEFRKRHGLGKR